MTTCERFSKFAVIAMLMIVLLAAPVSSSAAATVSHFVANGPFTDAFFPATQTVFVLSLLYSRAGALYSMHCFCPMDHLSRVSEQFRVRMLPTSILRP